MLARAATVSLRLALAVAACLTVSGRCYAQSLPEPDSVGALFGAGLERGGATGHSVVQPAPMFVDASIRHLAGSDSTLLLGGSLRVDIEGAGEVGIIPRAELETLLGPWKLRPGIGVSFYVAPHTLIGPVVSLGLRHALSKNFGLFGMLEVAAYIGGNDVPTGSSIVVGSLGVGVDMEL